jgi:hypothetical protein
MAALESYSVKPNGMKPMTIRALDGEHLSMILSQMFRKGSWKNLSDELPVEIKTPLGQIMSPPVREFRL